MSVLPIPEDVGNIHPKALKLFERRQWIQRTQPWYDIRKQLITASDAAAALGIKPFASFKGDIRAELISKKLNDSPVQGMALQHGIKYEPDAASLASSVLGVRFFEFGLLLHPEHEWLAASPDGVAANGFAIEIKCPLRRKIIPGEVPHHYMPQIQVQMEVCDLDACYFVQYKPGCMTEDGKPYIDITVVERDRRWFADNVSSLYELWDEFTSLKKTHVPELPPPAMVPLVDDELYSASTTPSYVREFDDSEITEIVKTADVLVVDDLYSTTLTSYIEEFKNIGDYNDD